MSPRWREYEPPWWRDEEAVICFLIVYALIGTFIGATVGANR